MITRREHHKQFSIKEHVIKLISKVIFKLNLNPPTPLPSTKLKFEKWKCEPLQGEQLYFITVCNNEINNGLRSIEIINGKVIDMVKKSDDEYRIKFKNNRVYKLSRYI